MGTFLIEGTDNLAQAAHHVGNAPDRRWDVTADGILFTDPALSDSECAALYVGYVPDPDWERPLPDNVRTHLQHLRDYFAADPANITDAQTIHLVKDLIRAIRYLNQKFE